MHDSSRSLDAKRCLSQKGDKGLGLIPPPYITEVISMCCRVDHYQNNLASQIA